MKTIINNLKFRLLVGLFFFLFTVFYGFGSFLIGSLKEAYTQTIEASLVTALKDIKHDYKDSGDLKETLNDIKEEFDIYPFFAQIALWNTQTQSMDVLMTSDDLKQESLTLPKALSQEVKQAKEGVVFTTLHLPSLVEANIKVGHTILEEKEGVLTVLSCGTVYKKHTPYVTQMTLRLWIGLGTLLVVMLVLVYVIISRSFSSVQRVIDEARSIKVDDMGKKITKTHIAAEIDNLIDTFNALIFELQNSYIQVKQFGQNASHELKTPLTIVRGEIEVGLKKERTQEEYRQILHRVHKEIVLLQEVIEKILFLSSITKGGKELFCETVYVDEIVHEVVEEKKSFAATRHITLHVKSVDALTTRGNAALLKIAIANVLDNAIKYSPPSAKVSIALLGTTLCIENEGEGIGEEEIEHIFERFYRGKKVLGVSGSGLGLSIVEAIIRLHDFKIDVKSVPHKVTTVSIVF